MMEKQNSMNKSKLVSVCSTQKDAFGDYYERFMFKGSSKSEKSQVEITIPTFPENLLYYEHYKTSSCKSSNRLSFIIVGGNDNGEVHHDFREYERVLSVDFSDHIRSVAAVFHVVSQLANCEDVRFHLSNSNIDISTNDKWLWANGAKTFMSKTVRYLKIVANGINEAKWEEKLTRVDEILKYAKAYFPNLEVVKIEVACPILVVRNKYVQVIEEFLDMDNRGSGFLPKLVAHCTSIQEGVVRCESFNPKVHGQIHKVRQPNISPQEHAFEQSTRFHKELAFIRSNGLEPCTTLPTMVKPNPFQFPQSASFEKELPPTVTFRGHTLETSTTFSAVPVVPSALQSTQTSSGIGPIQFKKIKEENDTNRTPIPHKKIKIEKDVAADSDEVQISEPPPKKPIDIIDILDSDDDNQTVAEQFPPSTTPSNQARPISSSSPCLSTISSTPSSSYSSPVRNYEPQSSSPASSARLKGSTFDDWENSSEEEHPRISPAPQPQLCLSPNSSHALDISAINNIPFDVGEISNIMKAVNAAKKTQGSNRRNSSCSFQEGVDYYRR